MKKHLYLFIYFALGVFVTFEADSFFGMLHLVVLNEVPEFLIYGFGCLCAAAGALVFLALRNVAPPLRQGLAVAAFALAVIALCVAGFAKTPALFWIALVVFYVAEGLNTAICAYHLHRLIQAEKHTGTLLAAAIVVGLTLNYGTDFFFSDSGLASMMVLSLAIAAMFFLVLRKIGLAQLLGHSNDVLKTTSRQSNKQHQGFLPTLVMVAGAIVVMSYLIGVNDVALITTVLSSSEPISVLPQALLYLPALLLAGVLADARGGRYLPIATLGCTLLATPIAIQLNSPELFVEYSGVTYFLGGFYLIYCMYCLVSLAWRSRHVALVTTLAPFLFFLLSGLGAFSSHFYIQASSAFLLTVYLGLAVLLLVIFYLSGSLQPKAAQQELELLSLANMPPLAELAAAYRLTKRETEVLCLLVEGKTTAEIADSMVIAERSVQNYINSMLTKTDCKSRGKLVAKFTRQEP